MEVKIDIISRELIKPSSPTPNDNKQLKLSLFDQISPQLYMRLLFLYQNGSPNFSSTLHLKQSLSECLTRFYPLAGKLNADHNYIDCDDSGVLFVEGRVHASLSEAVQNAPYEHLGQYLPFDDQSANGEGKTLLAIQLSLFKCGGIAIGISMSHSLGDLMSLMTFMNSWAAINCDEGTKLLLVPNFDAGRDLFPPRDSPYRFPVSELKGKIECKRFLFSKEKLSELKKLAISSSSSSSSSPVVKDPTRVEVVTAFLLKQFINAERAKDNNIHDSRSMFTVWHAVNLRSRFSSLAALSSKGNEFTFGNFSNNAIATFTIPGNDDDESGEEDHFRELVSLTRNSIRKLDEDYFLNTVVPYMDGLARSRTSGTDKEAAKTKKIHITSWCGISWHEVDFGWGKPASVGPAGTRYSGSTRVILMSSSSNRDAGIEAWIYMSEDEFALLPDELLSLSASGYFPVN